MGSFGRERSERTVRRPRLRAPQRAVAWWLVVLGLVTGAVVTGAALWVLLGSSPSEGAAEPAPQIAEAATATQTVVPSRVEVPRLSGLTLSEAETVLSAAGLAIRVRSESTDPDATTLAVVSQDPAPGVLAAAASAVTVVVRSVEPTAEPAAAKPPKPAEPAADQFVVCIDPGHQERGDSTPEPIGPGSSTVKPSVTGGATGVKTRVPEYEIVLQLSMNLKALLEERGVKVVMTRTTNDVNLSNSERAEISNKAGADLLVRVHADGSPDSSAAGFSTLYPGKNKWTRKTAAASKRAATAVQAAAVRATGAIDRGIVPRDDLSGFNWAKSPAVLVECGFMSNPVEDRLLASPHYQDKIAEGIADGVMAYLEAK